MKNNGSKLQKSLYRLVAICLVPLMCIVIFMIITILSFTHSYDLIVDDIIKVNAYNIEFKNDMDYTMYTIAVNSERAEELVDIDKPYNMIKKARNDFRELFSKANEDNSKNQLDRIIRSLDTLEDRVTEIVKDSKVIGSYDKNMERLDTNIRIITGLIQEQIQQYIYYQTINLDILRVSIKQNVTTSIVLFVIASIGIILLAGMSSWKIMKGIVEPVNELCDMAKSLGTGDFAAREWNDTTDELAILGQSFNDMAGQIGDLVEDVKGEQEKLRSIELQLLQEQINPHFLYNTLDTITWLSEMGENEQVINMVTALSDFFRTGLSNGQPIVTIRDEIKHVNGYLQIQQFRYQDILEYEVAVGEEILDYKIPKLTLQPLVENALYHGIKLKRGKGKITVTGEMSGDTILLSVKDDGIGIEPETLIKLHKMLDGESFAGEDGHGFGLNNVLQRIQLTYGNSFGMEITSEIGVGTEIKVIIPTVS